MFALGTKLLLIAAAFIAPQGESLKRSPFDQVRWNDERPEAFVDGKWNAVLEIDGVEIEKVLAACRAPSDRYWRKRFEEDLVTALTKCGHAPGKSVTLQVRILDGSQARTLNDVPMTTLNVLALRGAHNALHGIPPEIPRMDREHTKDVAPQFAEFTRPLRFELGNDVALARHDAEADLDQLEWLIENRFAFRDRVKLDRKALFDAARVGIGDSITRSELALHITKLLARFGDADTCLAGELALSRGSLPFCLGEARGGIVAYKPDRSGFVDAEHPFLTRIDDIDIEEWIKVSERISPGGAPQLVRHDAVRRLANLAWLRMETGATASACVKFKLSSEDRTRTKSIEQDLVPRAPIARESHSSTTGVIVDDNIGCLVLGDMLTHYEIVDRELEMLRPTLALVIDLRNCTGAHSWGMTALLREACPQQLPCALEFALYRMEPGAERNMPYLQRLGLGELSDNANRYLLGDASKLREAFDRIHPAPVGVFSDLQVSSARRWRSDEPAQIEKPVVVMCDATTLGNAEALAAAMHGCANVALIGEPTAGANGGPLAFRMERSGLVVRIATMVSFSPTGSIYAGCGVTPDVLVPKAASDFIGATDSQLAAAIDYLRAATSKPR